MPVFSEAGRALRQNLVWVAVYVVLATTFNSGFRQFLDWAQGIAGDGPVPSWLSGIGLAADVAFAAAWSAMQAIVFAQLGAAIDRPLWKCAGPGEALRKFFLPWFLLVLIALAVVRIQGRAYEAGQEDLTFFLETVNLIIMMAAIPIGACIMCRHGLVWSDLPGTLAPIARLPVATGGVFLIGMLQWILVWTARIELLPVLEQTPWVIDLIEAPLQVLDCYAFAAMWLICMLHRELEIRSHGEY